MADDIRISQTDIARIENAERRVNESVRKVDAAQVERLGRRLASAVDAAITKVRNNLDSIAAAFGITDPGTIRNIEHKLSIAQGGVDAVKATAGILAALPLPPHARLAILAAAATIGAADAQVDAVVGPRLAALAAEAKFEDELLDRQRRSWEAEAARLDAAVRRARAAR